MFIFPILGRVAKELRKRYDVTYRALGKILNLKGCFDRRPDAFEALYFEDNRIVLVDLSTTATDTVPPNVP